MRTFRILFTFLAVLFIAGTTSAQNKKVMSKAEAKVTELNDKLSAIDASLALSDEQVEQAQEIFMEGIKAMNGARKAAASKEEGKEATKALRKEMNKRIRKEVLSKEQKKALKKNTTEE